MEKFLGVLTLIGFVVMVFSIWSCLSIRKHIKQFKNNFRHTSGLTDEKYFELKSRQDFIIASAAVIFALLTFLGYSTIDNIRTDLEKQFQSQRNNMNVLDSTANDMVSSLRHKMSLISNKDIINQNIFIVDPLHVSVFSHDMEGKYKGYRFVKFSKLITILGKTLPPFEVPPSIILFSNNLNDIKLGEITTQGFYIKSETVDDISFSVWISEKPKGINYPPMSNAGDDQTIQLK